MAGYTRQSAANIVAGQVVRAAPLNLEFDTLQTAFSAATGHTHDGTTGSGPKILLTGANGISGILPAANGGTGFNSLSAAGIVTLTGTETLTNKTFTDATTTFQDDADNTKKMKFELSNFTTATTRIFTLPNATTTLYGRANILGFVGQSAGVPTGSILEAGSTANGNYIYYADGTAICWISSMAGSGNTSTVAGSVFKSADFTWSFPIIFTANPTVSGGVRSTTRWIAFGASTTTACDWSCFSYVNATVPNAMLMAVGRWF